METNVNVEPSQHGAVQPTFPLMRSTVETPLGCMIVLADARALHLLEFTDRQRMAAQIQRVSQATCRPIVDGKSIITDQVASALEAYFEEGILKFDLPLRMAGSAFQQSVWQALQTIAVGEKTSYLAIAQKIGRPKACRAVANAVGANAFAIVVPCHRVVRASGDLGGYAGGATRKAWLLDHEARAVSGA